MRRRVTTAYQLRHAKRSRIVTFLKILVSMVIVIGFLVASIYGLRAYQNAQIRTQSLSEVINGLRLAIPQRYPGVYVKPFDTKDDTRPSYPAHSSLVTYQVVPDMQDETTVFFWPKDSTVSDLEAKGVYSGQKYTDAVSRDKLMLQPVGQGVEEYMRDHGFTTDQTVTKSAASIDPHDHWQLYRRSDETCSVNQSSKGVTVSCQTQTLVDRVAILTKPLVSAYQKDVPAAKTSNLLVGQADFGSSKTPGYTYAYMPIGETTGGLNGTGVFYSHNSYWHFVAITLEGLSCNTIANNPDAKIALADQCDPSNAH